MPHSHPRRRSFRPTPLTRRQCLSSTPLRRPSELGSDLGDSPIKANVNPRWKPFSIPVRKLCVGDASRPLLLEILDWERSVRAPSGLSAMAGAMSHSFLDLTLFLGCGAGANRLVGLGSGRAPADWVPHDDAGYTDGPHPWAADSPPPSAGQGKGRGIDRGRPGYGRGAQQPLAPCQPQPCGAQNDLRLISEVLEGCCLSSDDYVSAELSSDKQSWLSLFWSGDAVIR